MSRTLVVHYLQDDYDVYVGRPSKWGNPYKLDSEKNRVRMIRRYTKYLLKQSMMLEALHSLRGLRLACYCAPMPCHADVLAALADQRVSELDLHTWAYLRGTYAEWCSIDRCIFDSGAK